MYLHAGLLRLELLVVVAAELKHVRRALLDELQRLPLGVILLGLGLGLGLE
jgi:hypothetical protein